MCGQRKEIVGTTVAKLTRGEVENSVVKTHEIRVLIEQALKRVIVLPPAHVQLPRQRGKDPCLDIASGLKHVSQAG